MNIMASNYLQQARPADATMPWVKGACVDSMSSVEQGEHVLYRAKIRIDTAHAVIAGALWSLSILLV